MIRTATDADRELVRELWHAFNVEIADAPWRDDDEGDFAPEISFLADDAGLVSLSREGTRRFFVVVLYVRPEARGTGVALDLMRAAAEHARAQGADVLELDVMEDNPRARRFYERLGFRPSTGALPRPCPCSSTSPRAARLTAPSTSRPTTRRRYSATRPRCCIRNRT